MGIQAPSAAADDSGAPPLNPSITYTEVVLGDGSTSCADGCPAGLQASCSIVCPEHGAGSHLDEPAPDAAGGVTDTAGRSVCGAAAVVSMGTHIGWTHFVVRQPDGGVHIAIDTEKLAKVTSLAGRTDQMDRPSRLARGSVSSAPLLGTPQSVIALQGSDHRRFWCHRAWYISAMSTYMIFNIVLIPLCVTQHSGRNTSGRGCCPRTVKDWIGHFNFSFTDSIAECCVDAAVTSCVAAAAILGAWLLRARVLTLSLAAQALLVSLSLATTLSPAVILRFVLLAVGLQLRASMMRWIPLSHPPFFKQLWQETKTLVHSARSACRRLLARCWNMSNSRRQSGSSSRNVESHPIGRSSVTLQLGDQVHAVSPQRQLVWNRGNGALDRDSPIVQASTRAVVSIDANGRRSVTMVNLGQVSATGAGNQSFR